MTRPLGPLVCAPDLERFEDAEHPAERAVTLAPDKATYTNGLADAYGWARRRSTLATMPGGLPWHEKARKQAPEERDHPEPRARASALATVIVAPLTSNVRRAEAIGNILLSPSQSGLDRPSVVLVCQLTTLDEDFFDELVGSLPSRVRRRVDRGLALALGLG